jgi:coenzyme F420-reducing hydrogenase beta subunit
VAHLLASGTVDAVLSITHADGLEYKARLVERPEQVDELPGSIYHSIDLSDVLKTLIANDKRLGLIALPCQLEGIYAYVSKVAPELRERLRFTVGLLCAWQYSRHSLAAVGSFYGFALEDIADVAYRGGGPIGKLRVKLRNGKEYAINRRANLFYQVAFDRYFNTPRCNVCINHTNYLADLVVGDSWIQKTRFSKTGVSLVICRTEQATAVVQQMEQQDRVVLVQATEDEVIESEGGRLVFGEFSYPYADYLREIGQWVPNLRGPNVGSGRPLSRAAIATFHAASENRQKLMYKGEYWTLFFGKLAREGHRIAGRYGKWFVNRVLMLKKLTGRDRHLRASDFSEFR